MGEGGAEETPRAAAAEAELAAAVVASDTQGCAEDLDESQMLPLVAPKKKEQVKTEDDDDKKE